MLDLLLFFMWPGLLITASVGVYYYGKYKGELESDQDNWLIRDQMSGTIKWLQEERQKYLHEIEGLKVELKSTAQTMTQTVEPAHTPPKKKIGRPRIHNV